MTGAPAVGRRSSMVIRVTRTIPSIVQRRIELDGIVGSATAVDAGTRAGRAVHPGFIRNKGLVCRARDPPGTASIAVQQNVLVDRGWNEVSMVRNDIPPPHWGPMTLVRAARSPRHMVVLAVFLALGLAKPLEWTLSRNALADASHRQVSSRAPRKQQRVRMINNRALPGAMARTRTDGPHSRSSSEHARMVSRPRSLLRQDRTTRLSVHAAMFQPLRC